MSPEVHLVRVFADGDRGGNPAPIVVDAAGLSDAQMREIARQHGHESAFVLPAPDGYDFALRFWVPNHEMPMCGHATIGAVWTLDRLGLLTSRSLRLWTASGDVAARTTADRVEITQPTGVVEQAPHVPEILSVLGIHEVAGPVQNAATSRVKTLVPLASVEALHALRPDFARMREICDLIGSTGLYPYARGDSAFHARQFPRSSGYPEDAATGIAAAALAFGLLANGDVRTTDPILVRQGEAMGSPSEISVRFTADGCWLGGRTYLVP